MTIGTASAANRQTQTIGLTPDTFKFSKPLADGGMLTKDQAFSGVLFYLNSMTDPTTDGNSLASEMASQETKSVADRLHEQLAAQRNLDQADWYELFGKETQDGPKIPTD